YNSNGYIMDPHTAVGKWVYDSYRRETGDTRKTILVSTASPFKFAQDVLLAILDKETTEDRDAFQILDRLASISKGEIPVGLDELKDKPILHDAVCPKEFMGDIVIKCLGLDG
ncbi:MAG TPA: threonine synthase, partial [Clostridia bacterium]|nr:threonine synthase [Clostridia bacterium]